MIEKLSQYRFHQRVIQLSIEQLFTHGFHYFHYHLFFVHLDGNQFDQYLIDT